MVARGGGSRGAKSRGLIAIRHGENAEIRKMLRTSERSFLKSRRGTLGIPWPQRFYFHVMTFGMTPAKKYA
jgi:hypothetical protein